MATAATVPVWPVNGVPMGWPVARSHTRTVLSPLPEITTGRVGNPTARGHPARRRGQLILVRARLWFPRSGCRVACSAEWLSNVCDLNAVSLRSHLVVSGCPYAPCACCVPTVCLLRGRPPGSVRRREDRTWFPAQTCRKTTSGRRRGGESAAGEAKPGCLSSVVWGFKSVGDLHANHNEPPRVRWRLVG